MGLYDEAGTFQPYDEWSPNPFTDPQAPKKMEGLIWRLLLPNGSQVPNELLTPGKPWAPVRIDGVDQALDPGVSQAFMFPVDPNGPQANLQSPIFESEFNAARHLSLPIILAYRKDRELQQSNPSMPAKERHAEAANFARGFALAYELKDAMQAGLENLPWNNSNTNGDGRLDTETDVYHSYIGAQRAQDALDAGLDLSDAIKQVFRDIVDRKDGPTAPFVQWDPNNLKQLSEAQLLDGKVSSWMGYADFAHNFAYLGRNIPPLTLTTIFDDTRGTEAGEQRRQDLNINFGTVMGMLSNISPGNILKNVTNATKDKVGAGGNAKTAASAAVNQELLKAQASVGAAAGMAKALFGQDFDPDKIQMAMRVAQNSASEFRQNINKGQTPEQAAQNVQANMQSIAQKAANSKTKFPGAVKFANDAGKIGAYINSLPSGSTKTALLNALGNAAKAVTSAVGGPLSPLAVSMITKDAGKALGDLLFPAAMAASLPPKLRGKLPINQKLANEVIRTGSPKTPDVFKTKLAKEVSAVARGEKTSVDASALNKAAQQEKAREDYIKQEAERRKQQEAEAAAQKKAQEEAAARKREEEIRKAQELDGINRYLHALTGTPYIPFILPFGGFNDIPAYNEVPSGNTGGARISYPGGPQGGTFHPYPGDIPPLLLDLDGDGIETTTVEEGVYFDHDLDGVAELSAWVGPDDGILAYDKNNNGVIDDATEIFGDFTITSQGEPAGDGFAALADLDSDHNGQIDASDEKFGQIRILTGAGSLLTLEELNIESVNLGYTTTNETDENGNTKLKKGSYHVGAIRNQSGRIIAQPADREISDIAFLRDPAFAQVTGEIFEPDEVAALPNLVGYGIQDLHQSILNDETGSLKSLVLAYVSATAPDEQEQIADQILYAWSGTNPENPDAKAQALSSLLGVDSSSLRPEQIEALYFNLHLSATAQLSNQANRAKFTTSTFDPDGGLDELITSAQTKIDEVFTNNDEAGRNLLYDFIRTIRGLGLDMGPEWDSFIAHYSNQSEQLHLLVESAGRMRFNVTAGMQLDLSTSDFQLLPLAAFGTGDGDTIITGKANDFLAGGDGIDTLYGNEGNDLLDGGNGGDAVYGQLGKDTLVGGTGDDQLDGGASRDSLIGGTGDDLLRGGGGDDTYYVALGDGIDTIDETTTTDTGADGIGTADDFDAIRFAEGINQADLSFAVDGTDLLINIGSSGDQTIHIVGQFDSSAPNARVEELQFADGSVVDYRAFNSGPQTMAADNLAGTIGADSLFGMAGNDTITADVGSDYVLAGIGDDTVSGDAGSDKIWGEEGNDNLSGGDGDDQIAGGTGDDTMAGGAGNDLYTFSFGAGQDRITEAAGIGDVTDTVLLAGILIEDITATTPNGQDLVLTLTDGSSLTIAGQLDTDATKYVEQFMFDDGTVFTSAELLTTIGLTRGGSTAGESVIGASGDDILNGHAGNDTLIGGAGNDIYVFSSGDGSDTINENSVSDEGLDTLAFGEGVDKDDLIFTATADNNLIITNTQTGDQITVAGQFGLDTSKQIETIAFSDGTNIEYTQLPSLLQTKGTAADEQLLGSTLDELLDGGSGLDTIDGGVGSDTIKGGAGNDVLTGGVDGDTYLYNRGDNDDVIIDAPTASSGFDRIVFGPGITLDDLTFTKPTPNDLTISIGGIDGGSITILGQYSGDTGRLIENIVLSDGTTFAIPGSNWVLGTASANRINRAPGADYITALAGNDTIYGGTGDDVILTGDGADRFVYGEDDNDVIGGSAGNDKLSGGKGNDILFGDADNDVLTGDDGNDSLHGGAGNDTLSGGLGNNVTFGDAGNDYLTGSTDDDTIDGGDGNDRILASHGANSVTGGTGADNITTGTGNDTVFGDAGDDALTTSSGDDQLTGGAGTDILTGGLGNDTYFYNLGDGSDTIKESGAGTDIDVIKFGEGISWDDITLNKDGTTNDLLISIAGQTDRIRVKGHFAGTQIEKFVFADGSEMPLDLYGQWSAVLGTSGSDKLVSPGLSDVRGFDGNDTLIAGSADDNLFGDAGNDSLVGGGAADIMAGGTGDDILTGGAGNDIYYYELGGGSDTINETSGIDRIEFGEGIWYSDLVFAADAENPADLLISINGSTDMLRVKNHFSPKGTGRIESFFFWEDGTELSYAHLSGASAVFGTDQSDALPPVTLPPAPLGTMTVYGFGGDDTINGRAGNDKLYGSEGHDRIIGNAGNDTISGGSGNDTFVYNVGDGDDVIIDTAGFGEYSYDTIHFGNDIGAENLQFSGSGVNDLIITITTIIEGVPTVGHIKIVGQFAGDISNKIERITFENPEEEAIYSSDIPSLLKIEGDNSDNTLDGTNVNVGEAIYGYDGNDAINAAGGNDSLYGGSGLDTLNGSIGNDVLEGGVGADSLSGSWGSDRYIFNTGDGADTIQESNKEGLTSVDIIEFGAGINGTDLTLTASGTDDLMLSLGGGDSITILGQLGNDTKKHIEAVKFADGTIVTSEFLKAGAILGTVGADSLAGGSGDDILVGSGGADTLDGQGGADTVYGGVGADTLYGGSGDETYLFNLGDGSDTVIDSNSTNGDTISFGAGIAASDLVITRDAGTTDLIIVYGSAANKIRVVDHFSILGTNKIEKIKLADGTIITSDNFSSVEAINGTEVSDAIQATSTANAVYAYEGNDVVDLNEGDDAGYGGIGNDVVRGLAGSDSIYGQAGDDALYGGDGDDLLDGGTEDDFLVGGSGADTYVFSEGSDLIDENNTSDTSTGDMVVFGDGVSVADVMFSRTGASGEDLTISLRGTDQSLTILGQFGTDTSKQVESFKFADETRTIAGGLPIITAGTEDDDTITGTALDDVFDGFEGDDSLQGLDGADILYGSDGDDTLSGNGGDDILVGGIGADSIAGGDGDDYYSFGAGEGDDIIADTGSNSADKIRFRDINLADVNFRPSGTEDLVIEILTTGETITVQAQLGADADRKIESIEFADGTVIADLPAYLIEHLQILATTGDDQLFGSDVVSGETINALAGNDTIYAGAGPDTVNGGDGDDFISGGTGDDILDGGSGSDTYLFTRGQGADTINEAIDLATTIGIDTLRFADDIAPEDIQFSASGNDLIVTLIGTADSVTIKDQFSSVDPSMQLDNVSAVEEFVFANGVTYVDMPPLQVIGTIGADNLVGSDFNESISGNDGDDTIIGGRRDDNLAGDVGDDTVDAGSGDDIITGGFGNDRLTGGSGDDTYIVGIADDSDRIIESSTVGEDGGIDTIDLSGATGVDSVTLSRDNNDLIVTFPDGIQKITVEGHFSNEIWKRVEYIKLQNSTIDVAAEFAASTGANDDPYTLALGDGSVVVNEADATDSDKDAVTFGTGIAESQLMFEADGDDLVVSVLGTTDKITLTGQYSSDPANRVEEFKLNSGTVVSEALLHRVNGTGVIVGTEQSDVIRATGASASLFGDLGDDVLIGTSGADKIYGNEGNDRLLGNAGNDTLVGGLGNDVYFFDPASGAVTVNETTDGGDDTIQFGAGITSGDLSWSASGEDVVVTVAGSSASWTLVGQLQDDATPIESIRLSDGTIIDGDQLKFGQPINGTSGAESLNGSALFDTISGGGDDDTISGGSGRDTLYGGAGNDIVDGGAGRDTLFGDAGDDLADGGEEDDVIDGGDGTDIVVGAAGNDSLTGGDGTDSLVGGDGEDVLDGGAGADTLEGGAGNDFYKFSSSSGNDQINDIGIAGANGGIDTLEIDPALTLAELQISRNATDLFITVAATGNTITIENQFGDDGTQRIEYFNINGTSYSYQYLPQLMSLQGTAAADTLSGQTWSEYIYGQAGDDTIDAGDGDDVLIGGTGNDSLVGGTGSDTYLFNIGDGQDIINEATSEGNLDSLVLGDELTSENVTFARTPSTDDLVISIDGTSDAITVSNYFNDVLESISINGLDLSRADVEALIPARKGTESADLMTSDPTAFRTYGLGGADTIYGQDGAETVFAGAGDDIVYAADGDDRLEGGDGNDTLLGEAGNDHIYGQVGVDSLLGDAGADTLEAGDGDDFLVGGADSDRLVGDAGDDVIQAGSEDDTAYGGIGDDTVEGDSGADLLSGDDGADSLLGGDGADTLTGATGSDTVIGGAGDDTYIFNLGDGADEIAESTTGVTGAGIDTLAFGDGISLADLNTSRSGDDLIIALEGSTDQITLKNQFSGNSSDLIENISFDSGAVFGTDVLIQGDDIDGSTSADSLSGTWKQESIFGHEGADTISGDGLNDFLDGGDDGDILIGGLGNDTVLGGIGDDTYKFSSGDGVDTIGELDSTGASGGSDTLEFGPGITLGSISTERVGDDLAITFTGNSDQIILTNQFGDDDTQKIEFVRFDGQPAQNIVVLYSGPDIQGTSGSDSLAGTWQSERIFGDGGDDTITGAGLWDSLYGGDGNDTLNGEDGVDLLAGGTGNDTYYIDATGDFIYEATGEGQDTVISSISHHLYNNVENLILSGADNLSGIGNTGANTITGNSGNNTIDGGAGADTMYGGAGDDRYLVDNAADVVIETSSNGMDTIVSGVTYTLSANVESLVLSSSGSGTGNTLDNYMLGSGHANSLFGDAGNDTLDGSWSADTLIGGDGDDLYIIDSAGDLVIETGTGMDTVQSSVTYSISLQSGVENLSLTGSSNMNAIGNTLNNIITGNTGNNSMVGGDGDDTLYGGGGTDTLVGGDGNDSFYVDSLTDAMTETSTGGTADTEFATFSDTLYAYIEHLTLLGTDDLAGTGNAAANILTGNSGNNTLNGSSGNDTLLGGEGDDSLVGGAGNDDSMAGGSGNDIYVVDSATEAVIEATGEGIDTIATTVNGYTLRANVENLTLTAGTNQIGYGNELSNYLMGTGYHNTLDGGAGNDTIDGGPGTNYNDSLIGGTGDDLYFVNMATDLVTENAEQGTDTISSTVDLTLTANVENLILTGTAALDGTGNSLDNYITGNSGINTLDGGDGADTLAGGAGNDTYKIYDQQDMVLEDADSGTDTIVSTVSYSLSALDNVEILTLTSGTTATGNSLNNKLTGNAENNTIDGALGADTMIGGTGNDTYYVDNTGDVVTEVSAGGTADIIIASETYALPVYVENLTLAPGAGNIGGTGNTLTNTIIGNDSDNLIDGGDGADTIIGGDGNDTLSGGTGADQDSLIGSTGNDVYIIDNALDKVIEDGDDLYDTIQTSVTFSIADLANIENITLTGTTISGIGNSADNYMIGSASANTLTGMDGNDTLDGGAGSDSLIGNTGNDSYIVNAAGDKVTEQTGEGFDTVYASATYALGADQEIERFILTGTAAINATGNNLNNEIIGNSGANSISGGTGTDTLQGGGGNDIYVVDDLNDLVIETATGGIDTIQTTIAYSLAGINNVEGLTITGSGSVSATGNALNNTLTGNTGANTLDGGTGADTMIGGTGNDVYIVDNAGDVVTDTSASGGGTADEVRSSVGYTLGSYVERLTLTGTSNINATGNTLSNYLTGNSGNNILNASTGTDTIEGGAGNDTYIIDSATADQVIENADEGTDTVQIAATYTLKANFENLVLAGAAAIHGTGNELNNFMIGTSGANSLTGAAGNDTLDGAAGNDTLSGGDGDDVYYVDSDVVIEQADDGNDTVFTSTDFYGLDSNIENLVLTGTDDLRAFGNSENNLIIGNAGNNYFFGSGGIDTMYGGNGDDYYELNNPAGIVFENADEGFDGVRVTFDYTLGTNLEGLWLFSGDIGVGNELDNGIYGNSGNNSLVGGPGNDYLSSNGGVDTLVGGLGDDTYSLPDADSTIIENADEGIDTISIASGFAAGSYTLGANFENLNASALSSTTAFTGIGNSYNNLIVGGSGNDTLISDAGDDSLFGGSGNDSLVGGIGNDTLNGGSGALSGIDTLAGGAGNDVYYVDSSADVILEASGEGVDTVYVIDDGNYTLGANIENVIITSSSVSVSGNGADNLFTGSANSDTLDGGAGNDTLSGGSGSDTLIGGLGHDIYIIDSAEDLIVENANEGTDSVQSSVSYTLVTNVENLTLTGTSNTSATGNSVNNSLTGNSGNNTLDGAAGADAMNGGAGDDTYIIDNIGDGITDSAGVDTVISSISYSLGSTLENLTLTGTSSLSGNGNNGNNVLVGNAGNNTLNGLAGNDTFEGGLGDDVYFVDGADTVTENSGQGTDTIFSGADYTLDANVENLVLMTGTAASGGGNTSNNYITGNSNANTLTGGAGNDTLDGASGSDSLDGGSGDDTYFVDSSSDAVSELSGVGTGTDTVNSTSVTYTLATNVENLVLVGSANIAGTGNMDNNTITGNSGNNTLDGGSGDDTLAGSAGDDTYIVDALTDLIVEAENGGTDTVQTGLGYSLGVNLENLTLTGSAAVSATGNELNNSVVGNSGANTINGGIGADTMSGGTGDDLYFVDDAGDTILENSAEGADSVQSSVSHTLSANVENLSLIGSASINVTGNASNNLLTGNAGDNILNGATGNDTLVGGTGNDIFIIDVAGDVLIENADEGTDTVNASASYTLLVNFENLVLTGNDNITGTGNSVDNIITGNSGANTLDGADGADSLAGGAGNDTYLIDTSDVLTENSDEGIDTVQAGFSYTLGSNFENLVFTGSSAFTGTGNSLNNTLIGNSGDNVLDSDAGDDTLDGGAGTDSLIGGTGNDFYILDSLLDVITENSGQGTDTIQIDSSYTLGANFENLILTGTSDWNGIGNSLANYITGNSGANSIIGDAGNDTLDGAGGIDTLVGGTGDDMYYLNIAGTTIIESASEGIDTVIASLDYTLAAGIENLTLVGSARIAIGNSENNYLRDTDSSNGWPGVLLYGGAGNDTLDSAGGWDSLNGGDGDDTYILREIAFPWGMESIFDSSGTDTLDLSSFNSDLEYNYSSEVSADFGNACFLGGGTVFEKVYGGSGNDTFNGATISETIYGGSGEDVISGNGGDDQLYGDDGDDEFDGDEGNDQLYGGNGVDRLHGGEGNDTLCGGSGNDSLEGGTGNDTYLTSKGYGSDTINTRENDELDVDIVQFDSTVSATEVAIFKNGSNLEIGFGANGNTEKITILQDANSAGIAKFVLNDGTFLSSDDINRIVEQMSIYASNNNISLTSLNDVKGNTALMNIVATAWHN